MPLYLVPMHAGIGSITRTTLKAEREARRYSTTARGYAVDAPDAATAFRAVLAAYNCRYARAHFHHRSGVPILAAEAALAARLEA